MPTYVVGGFLIGPALPNGRADFGPVIVAPAPPETIERLRLGAPTIHAIEDPLSFSAVPARLTVRSAWTIRWVGYATDKDEAEVNGTRAIRRVVGALSLIAEGAGYRVEIQTVENTDTGEPWSPWSPLAVFCPFDPAELRPAQTARVNRILRTIDQDETATVAMAHLQAGIDLRDQTSSATGARHALLEFYMTIEGISDAIVDVTRGAQSAEEQEERSRIVADLISVLADDSLSPKKQAARIQEAAGKLNALSLAFASLRVGRACEVLRLTADDSTDAVAFAKLRNNELGHTGEVAGASLTAWLGESKAERLARRFLAEYVAWVESNRGP